MSSSLLTPDSDPNFLCCTSPCSKSLPPGFCFLVCFIYLFLLLFLSSVFLFLYSILTHGSMQPLIPSYQNLSMASLRASLPAEQSLTAHLSLWVVLGLWNLEEAWIRILFSWAQPGRRSKGLAHHFMVI